MTEQEIRQAIAEAGHKRGAVLEDAINYWLLDVLDDGPWERWSCADENCPARPDYDKALSDLFEEVSPTEIAAELEAIIVDRFTPALFLYGAGSLAATHIQPR